MRHDLRAARWAHEHFPRSGTKLNITLLTTRRDASILFPTVNYQQRLGRTFVALIDPNRRAILAHSRLHDDETRRTHEEGWTGSLDKLDARFAGGEAA
jgi:hypothetical protein